MTASEPRHITSNAALAEHCEQWRQHALITLDTEFVRETTFYPIPGLVQVGVDGLQYLVDPLAIDDWGPLQSLLADPIPKVLHACGEDIEVFQRLLGVVPQPMYDTQVGAALTGWGFGLGYQALVQQVLGIHVDKEHTRSNWVARPLSPEQCHYAALDVAYLPELYARISERLDRLGRLTWWREEGERAVRLGLRQADPAMYYQKLGAGFRLRGRQVAVLQQLCLWRETEARRLNMPRGRILKDAECLEVARRLPQSVVELGRIPDMNPQHVRAFGVAVLALIESVGIDAEATAPIEAPLPREWGSRLNRLRELVAERAKELDLPPELLVRKRDCEYLLRTGQLPEPLQGWRFAAVGEDLLTLSISLT